MDRLFEALKIAPDDESGTKIGNGLELASGPDSFVARKPWAVDLCREMGLEMTEPGARDALIWTERGLVPLPESALGVPTDLDEIARWPGLSRRGRVRALADLVRKPRPPWAMTPWPMRAVPRAGWPAAPACRRPTSRSARWCVGGWETRWRSD